MGEYMSRSVFPNGVDEFPELFDLPFDKVEDAKRLTELKMLPRLSSDEESELMALTNSLKDYLITPETMNKFTDALVAVERFFYQNVQGFIEDKQKTWQSYVANFKFVGEWREGFSYYEQNMVINKKGDLYFCRTEHVSNSSNEPNEKSAIWIQMSSKGEKGDIGLNAHFKGEWESSKQYTVGDAVGYSVQGEEPVVYIAKKTSTGSVPNQNPNDWMLYTNIYVGREKPKSAAKGLHFLKKL